MSLTVKDSHTHKYDTIEILVILQVQKNYQGDTGDKSILLRTCECGDKQAFDMGDTPSMKEKMVLIRKGNE